MPGESMPEISGGFVGDRLVSHAGAAAPSGIDADSVADIKGFARVDFLDDGNGLATVEADFDLETLFGRDRLLKLRSNCRP